MSAFAPFWAAWPTSPASLYAGAAMARQMGPRGKVTSFTNAQGLRLACYFWPAAARAKAVVQLLHGDAGYAMRFLHSLVRRGANQCSSRRKFTSQVRTLRMYLENSFSHAATA